MMLEIQGQVQHLAVLNRLIPVNNHHYVGIEEILKLDILVVYKT
jgi:hypothetical protein